MERNNMENRIQINGVWYVMETPEHKNPISYEIDEDKLTYSESCVYENDKYCFEATRIFQEYDLGKFYGDVLDIEFTDKRGGKGNWITEQWDSIYWLNGVLERNIHSIETLRESMCHEGVETFISFLKVLKNKGWL
jgi:hypothetical protein